MTWCDHKLSVRETASVSKTCVTADVVGQLLQRGASSMQLTHSSFPVSGTSPSTKVIDSQAGSRAWARDQVLFLGTTWQESINISRAYSVSLGLF